MFLIFYFCSDDGKEAFLSKLSNKLSMNFAAEFGLSEFSFSQLIVAVKKLFDTEGIPGFVKALII